MIKEMNKRLYDLVVGKNEYVKYEYERYVREHLEEHYIHRFRHIKLLWKLIVHFEYKKSTQPLLYWNDDNHPLNKKYDDYSIAYKNMDFTSASNHTNNTNVLMKTSLDANSTEKGVLTNLAQIDKLKEQELEVSYIRKKVEIKEGSRILFISNTQRKDRPILDASTRYRCYHPAEALLKAGVYTSVTSLAEFVKNPLPLDYDIYIFHRPGLAGVKKVKELKYYQKTVIADYDDLIFGDEATALESSLYKSGRSKRETVIEIFNNNYIAMQDFDIFTCSTEELAICIKNEKKDAIVNVVHNFLPESVLKRSAACVNHYKDLNQIVYCCGTTSHNKDFKIFEEIIIKCLKQDPTLKLFIIGPLTIDSELNNMANVFFHKSVDYWDLFDIMSYSAFAIAPLEISPFNVCKSNVKFLEAAATGVTLWATPIPDMIRIGEKRVNLCKKPEDFENCIINRHEDYREEQKEINRHFVEQYCSNKQFYKEIETLKEYLERE